MMLPCVYVISPNPTSYHSSLHTPNRQNHGGYVTKHPIRYRKCQTPTTDPKKPPGSSRIIYLLTRHLIQPSWHEKSHLSLPILHALHLGWSHGSKYLVYLKTFGQSVYLINHPALFYVGGFSPPHGLIGKHRVLSLTPTYPIPTFEPNLNPCTPHTIWPPDKTPQTVWH